MNNNVGTSFEFDYAVVDIATDSATVRSGAALLRGIYINTSLSAHDLPIYDGSTLVFTIPATSAAGYWIPFGDLVFKTSLLIDPNNSATGGITVIYKKRTP